MENKTTQEVPQQKLTSKDLLDYKKNLRQQVEMLELQARYTKAKVDIYTYSAELNMIEDQIRNNAQEAKETIGKINTDPAPFEDSRPLTAEESAKLNREIILNTK